MLFINYLKSVAFNIAIYSFLSILYNFCPNLNLKIIDPPT